MPYLVKADSLLRAKERANNPGSTADAFLNELLDMSAGAVGGVIHYRPMYCAAMFLQQDSSIQTLAKADGVEFTGLVTKISSLFGLQAAYDAQYQLVVPAGFEVLPPTKARQIFGSVSLKTVVLP